MLRTIVAAGLPPPVAQHRVRIGRRTYRLDGAYPEYLVALEDEGFDFHTSRTAFDDRDERDRDRTGRGRLVADARRALELRGWPGTPVLP